MGYSDNNLHRKVQIEDGLLAMMGDRPYDTITVKDLTEYLHIARKTFYLYFPNKQACLESLTDRLIYECNLNQLLTVSSENDFTRIYEDRFRFWICHKDFLDAVIRNNMDSFFLNRILMYLRKEKPSLQEELMSETVAYDDDILCFYISGQVYLLLKWCGEGFTIPLEEMVCKMLRLLHEPLSSLRRND